MAMYYYASKLNEASCSGCHIKVPPAPTEPAPVPPPPPDHAPAPPTPAVLHGTGLSFYDNDDYYSMVRGSKFISDSSCKHIVMNRAVNYVAQNSGDPKQIQGVLAPAVNLPPVPYSEVDKPEVEFKDGHIVSATLESLVDMLRPGASKQFTFTFLLCSRLYVKPHELLGKLCKRYFKTYEKIGKVDVRDMASKELSDMACLVRILKQWTSSFPYDFRDDRVMALVRNITQRCAAEHMSSVRGEVSLMLEKLLEKLTALEQYEQTLVGNLQVSSVDQVPQGDILSLGLSPVELANQLTMIELHRLSFVGPEEFVQTFAHGPPPPAGERARGISLPHVDTKTTKNLEAYADWFNRLSYMVATDVVKGLKSKHRACVIEQWVMTARECFNLGNFNSLMAVISALNMSPVSRLKKTWAKTSPVCGQQLRQLELCVEPSGNHSRYRAALAAAPTETAVPLLSVTCRDLHFANQGSPNRLAGNRVNFEKCTLLARHVSSQLAARRLMSDAPAAPAPAPAPAPAHAAAAAGPAPHAWRFLNDRPTLTDNELELTSFEREPPADHGEKERLKRLRSAP